MEQKEAKEVLLSGQNERKDEGGREKWTVSLKS